MKINWQEIAKAIELEALFTECCRHDFLCFIQEGEFNLDDYFSARESFASRLTNT
jgi:hypothetical protein